MITRFANLTDQIQKNVIAFHKEQLARKHLVSHNMPPADDYSLSSTSLMLEMDL